MFASGNKLMHPWPILEAFVDYQISGEWVHEFGLGQLTESAQRVPAPWSALRGTALAPSA
jgi:hypothetical protein